MLTVPLTCLDANRMLLQYVQVFFVHQLQPQLQQLQLAQRSDMDASQMELVVLSHQRYAGNTKESN